MPFKLQTICGPRRRIGQEIGKLARPRMAAYLAQSPVWAALRPWRGHAYLDELAGCVQRALPSVWEEFEGLAEGLRMPLPDVLLWHCRGELLHSAPEGCTSIAWHGADGTRWIGHNEDGDPYLYGRCLLLDVRPDDAPGYVAFAYPGSLPGHTFGANRAGLVQVINNLRTRRRHAGVPRMFLARAVLDCATLDQALAVLQSHPRAGGFHHLLGAAREPRIVGVEAAPGLCSVQEVTRGTAHANHLTHPGAERVPQIVTDSSRARQSRAENLMDTWPPQADGDTVVAALLDEQGPLPILRRAPDDPDQENTLATALFEMRDGGLALRIHDRSPEPVLTLPIL